MAERKRIVTKPVIVERLEKEDWNALVRESALELLANPGATLDIVNDVFAKFYAEIFSPTLIRNLANTSFRYAEILEGVRREFPQAWMTANYKGEIKTQLLSSATLVIEEREKWILNDILSLERESLEVDTIEVIKKVIKDKVTFGELYKWREGSNKRHIVGGLAREVIEFFGIKERVPGQVFVKICNEVECYFKIFHEEEQKKREADIKAAKEYAEMLRAQRSLELAEIAEKKKKEEEDRQKKLWEKRQRKEAR
ncbi:MAG: hypothetical protein Q7T50_06865, partial [Candidatus Magasanikbacteria bacterium]|nr:hypothetical protein [Candidatus Magasanikbacteria bacterium]